MSGPSAPASTSSRAFSQGRMKTVVVAEADARRRIRRRRLCTSRSSAGVERAGLFHEHVLAGAHGGKAEGRERGVERGDDDRADGRVGERGGVIGDGLAAGHRLGEGGGAGGVEVAGIEQAGGAGRAAARFRPTAPHPIRANPMTLEGDGCMLSGGWSPLPALEITDGRGD